VGKASFQRLVGAAALSAADVSTLLRFLIAASAASGAAAAPPVIRETKEMQAAKKVKRKGGFGDFSAW
jgi:hypothetical protein